MDGPEPLPPGWESSLLCRDLTGKRVVTEAAFGAILCAHPELYTTINYVMHELEPLLAVQWSEAIGQYHQSLDAQWEPPVQISAAAALVDLSQK